MSTTQYDSRTADKFVVRLPDGLRAEIEGAADHLDRSMNSIFVQATRQYLDAQQRQQLLLDTLAELAAIKAQAASFNIDEHVRMAADAGRYRWLRDAALGTGCANVPMVRIGAGDPVGGDDLDKLADAAGLNWPMPDEFAEELAS
ncbi:CopG family ribbon-helix-helix protein [Pseudomonas fluorescens]|uniref:Arc-like DNA binding domain-containing protein n=1 Tax=Pseudomonas fluorescens TaxID=294 RepID=A0A5E7EV73_PSEFL|nr:Arc family DNA-binding protein [Pseudomonas fluorescens]VVO30808.1 hypothetical protein PS723_04975 [Pseudomonas fluorescens]